MPIKPDKPNPPHAKKRLSLHPMTPEQVIKAMLTTPKPGPKKKSRPKKAEI